MCLTNSETSFTHRAVKIKINDYLYFFFSLMAVQKLWVNGVSYCWGFDIFTFIYGLRRNTPWIQKIVELLCIYRIIKEKHSSKGDLFWTVLITRTFDTYIVTRPGGWGRRSSYWVLLSLKTNYKISLFHPEIPGFDPGTFGVETKCTSNELLGDSVQQTIKTHPE